MQYPGALPTGGGYSLDGDDPNSLENRKKQLMQKLLGQQNQSGLTGTHAMPLYGGGGGRSASELQQGGMPSLTFNPFLAMAAGRPDEVFQAPNGLTQQALASAQAGFAPNQGGGAPGDPSAPQNLGGNAQQAADVFIGASQASGGGIAGSPGAAQPNGGLAGPTPTGFLGANTSGNVRHLVGGIDPRMLQPFFGNAAPLGRALAS